MPNTHHEGASALVYQVTVFLSLSFIRFANIRVRPPPCTPDEGSARVLYNTCVRMRKPVFECLPPHQCLQLPTDTPPALHPRFMIVVRAIIPYQSVMGLLSTPITSSRSLRTFGLCVFFVWFDGYWYLCRVVVPPPACPLP